MTADWPAEPPAAALPAYPQLGRGDVAEARAVSNRLLGIGLGAGAALAAAFWLAEPIIPGIFSSDAGAWCGPRVRMVCGAAGSAWLSACIHGSRVHPHMAGSRQQLYMSGSRQPVVMPGSCRQQCTPRHPASRFAQLLTCPASPPRPAAEVGAAVRAVLPIAVAMLPINAAVYVFDGVITGAADFKFMAGAPHAVLCCAEGCAVLTLSSWQVRDVLCLTASCTARDAVRVRFSITTWKRHKGAWLATACESEQLQRISNDMPARNASSAPC